MSTADGFSTLVRAELWQLIEQTGTTQVVLAQQTGFTPKHINQMLQGKVRISPEIADELLAVFGRQLVIGFARRRDAALPALIANGKRGANARPPATAASGAVGGPDSAGQEDDRG